MIQMPPPGGIFLCNRGGVMTLAATRLIALHKNKGMTVAACLKNRTDYMKDACSWPLIGALLVRCPSRAYSSHRLSRWF